MKRQNYKTFRQVMAVLSDFWGRMTGKTRSSVHPNPILRDPYLRTRSSSKPKKRPGKLKLEPGTIRYHDWLVKELGYDRRLADGYEYAYLNGYDIKMPMPDDFRMSK